MPAIRLFLLLCLAAPAAANDVIPVVAGIDPVRYLVERVGGGHVAVASMVRAGQRPETYDPTPRQVTALGEARVFFGVGLPLEAAWRGLAGGAGGPRWVNLSDGLSGEASQPGSGTPEDAREQGDNHDHEHGHGGFDPHTWLDPENARQMVAQIRDVLAHLKPEIAEMFAGNAARLSDELEALDREIAAVLADAPVKAFLVFHPAWGHFARAYGLEQLAVESEGKEPGPRTLARVIEEANRHGIRTVFLEPGHGRRLAETVAEAIGGEIATLDPLAYDYIDNLRGAALAIAASGP